MVKMSMKNCWNNYNKKKIIKKRMMINMRKNNQRMKYKNLSKKLIKIKKKKMILIMKKNNYKNKYRIFKNKLIKIKIK